MLKMRVHAVISGGVTFFHDAPPSLVIWIWPSSVPAQRIFTSSADGDNAVIAPIGAGGMSFEYFPALFGAVHVCRARSELMRVQWAPPSIVFHTAFEA